MTVPAPRFVIPLPVELSIPATKVRFEGVSENISATGVLVRAKQLLPLRASVHLQFPEFATEGEIIWSRSLSEEASVLMGLRFVGMSGDAQRALLDVLAAPRDKQPSA